MKHSGDCIHSPVWDGQWDHLILTPEVTQISPGTKAYKLGSRKTSYHDAWACDTCTSRPDYFAEYLFSELTQLTRLD